MRSLVAGGAGLLLALALVCFVGFRRQGPSAAGLSAQVLSSSTEPVAQPLSLSEIRAQGQQRLRSLGTQGPSVYKALVTQLADDIDKALGTAAAVKAAVGDSSAEGQNLTMGGLDVDMEAIKKVQEEAKQAADAEIDAATAAAKTEAQNSYASSRDKFMTHESDPEAPTPSDDIYPPEGSPGRPEGYARKPGQTKQKLVVVQAHTIPEQELKALHRKPAPVQSLIQKAEKLEAKDPHHIQAERRERSFLKELALTKHEITSRLQRMEKMDNEDAEKYYQSDEQHEDQDDAEADQLYKKAIDDLLHKLQKDIEFSYSDKVPKAESTPPAPPVPPPKAAGPPAPHLDPSRLTPVVETDCGAVQGVREGAFKVYKGIPYGKPPVGNLRWASPVAASSSEDYVPMSSCWVGTLEATSFGNVCPQIADPAFSNEIQSEDCLNLNVYAPIVDVEEASADLSTLLPVVLFIHGGGNIAGAGSRYDMSRVAERGFIAVTINYRLGAFGFLATESLSKTSPSGTSGNYGIRDIALATEWVAKNIKAFGGDPSKITLMGHGSGGTNALAMVMSPLGKDANGESIFDRVVVLSGGANIATSLEVAERHNEVLSINAGCSAADHEQHAACLRKLPVDEVLKASPLMGKPYWDKHGNPAVDTFDLPENGALRDGLVIVDGAVVPTSSWHTFGDKSKQANVPILFMVMAEESDANPPKTILDSSDFEKAVEDRLDSFGWFHSGERGEVSFSHEAMSLYPLYLYESPQQAYESMVTDSRYVCGHKRLVGLAAKGTSKPVFMGINKLRLSEPVAVVSLSSNGVVAAVDSALIEAKNPGFSTKYSFHGLDIQMYMQDESKFSLTGEDLEKAKKLQGALDHFVSTGTTEGYNALVPPSPYAYSWKPVSDSPEFLTTDELGMPVNIDIAILDNKQQVTMNPHYQVEQCDFWSRDAIDRMFAA